MNKTTSQILIGLAVLKLSLLVIAGSIITSELINI